MKTILILMTLLPLIVKSQEFINLSGGIENYNDHNLNNFTVKLYNLKDSILMKEEFFNETGEFEFNYTSKDSVYIQINQNNHVVFSSSSIPGNISMRLAKLYLANQNWDLQEVSVVKKKPYLERSPGKLTVNVENGINATGSSAFEIIEKSPGVSVQSGDNIMLNGKQGVIIQIDGKRIPMTGEDLGNYLRGITSASVEKIEFITNPSAKYDAAGTSIIDIKLKKDLRYGTNGTIANSFGQGVYSKASSGITLNHRTKKLNLYGNYNYGYRKGFNQLDLERYFYENDSLTGAYIQKNYFSMPLQNNIARIGLDYTANDKHSFSFISNFTSNSIKTNGSNKSDVVNQNNILLSKFGTESFTKSLVNSFSTNLNHKLKLDTLGSEISTDIDYATYGSNSNQNFDTRYYNLNNEEYLNPYILDGKTNGLLSIYSLKSDLSKTINAKTSFETGLKSSYVKADNDVQFFESKNNQMQYDTSKSNHFIYDENINSFYFTLIKNLKKWKLNSGLRIENTNIKGKQVVTGQSFDSSYIQLFPTFSASFSKSENHSFDFNYNRRIDRPSYDQLNPFKFYLDPTTYREGNPYLKPQTTHTIEMGYTYQQKYYATIGYTRTKNNITEIIAPISSNNNVTVQTNTNLQNVDVYYIGIALPFDVTNWWNSTNNINSYMGQYSGDIANTQLKNSGNLTYNIASNNTFKISKSISSELNINYKAKEIYAFDVINPIWFVNVGAQMKVFKNKGTLRMNFTDVFFSNKIQANVKFTNYQEHFIVRRENSVLTFSFTYRFGNSQVQGVKRRMTGADDLKNRVGQGGNS